MIRYTKTLAGALLMVAAALGGCSNTPIDEIEEEVDCNDVCNRYRDCFDSGYDTAACRNRCQGVVDGDDPAQADMCDACLDTTSCVGAFGCGTECAGIIP